MPNTALRRRESVTIEAALLECAALDTACAGGAANTIYALLEEYRSEALEPLAAEVDREACPLGLRELAVLAKEIDESKVRHFTMLRHAVPHPLMTDDCCRAMQARRVQQVTDFAAEHVMQLTCQCVGMRSLFLLHHVHACRRGSDALLT